MEYTYLLTIAGIILLHLEGSKVNATAQEEFIESLLNPDTYNRMERPGAKEGIPTVVDIDLFVSSMNDISEITMNFHLNMFLRQRWQDKRLSFTNHSKYNSTSLTLNHNYITKMWQPDTFLKNEVTKGSFHDLTVPNILINLDPEGRVLYSQRISTKLSCNMQLEKYPLDNQTCYIEMESYGYKTTEMILRWNNVNNPIQVNNKLELPEFNLTSFFTGECTVEYTTGAFSCINASLHLDRLTSYYIIQVYIPTVLIVILSWVSFWIDYKAVPARISVGLLTVLTITTKSSSISSKLPKVSYIKAIDVWMFTCTVFVFAALIEYSVVNVLARRQQENAKLKEQLKKKKEQEMYELKEKSAESNGVQIDSDEPTTVNSSVCHQLRQDEAMMVEIISRYIFPTAFALFNLFYWIMYLTVHE